MRLAICVMIPGALLCPASLAAPIAAPDSVVLPQCSETLVNVLANDRDSGELLPLTLVSVSEASLGTAEIAGPDVIRFVSRDRSGTDVLTYVVRNAAGDVSPGQVAINVSSESRCS